MVGDNNFSIRNLRTGTPVHKNVVLQHGNSAITVAVVALSADEMQQIDEIVQDYATTNAKKVNDSVRGQYYNRLLAYYCMRDPSDKTFTARVAESVDEVGQILDIEDISRVVNAYGELMINKAPKLEALTQEQYDTIKKHLEETPLKDLSTVLCVLLKNCLQTIQSEK